MPLCGLQLTASAARRSNRSTSPSRIQRHSLGPRPMSRILALSLAALVSVAGCTCSNFAPVDDCNGVPCVDGGGGGSPGTGGGTTAGGSAGGDAGGSVAGGDAGGSTAGGDAGGSVAGGAAGGSVAGGAAGGSVAGGTAGGSIAGGAAGGSVAGGAAGGSVAGGAAGGSVAGGGSASDGGVYDFCGEVARRECDFYIRCLAAGTLFGDTVTGRTNNVVPASQRSLCEARRREECRIQQAGAERGRRVTNLTALRTCLDAQFPSSSCARDRNAALSVCDATAFTTPLATAGSVCTGDEECTRSFCNIPGATAVCGVCTRFSNPDGGTANCTRTEQCAPGTFCRQGQCSPVGLADAGCGSTSDCAPGYVCPASTGGPFGPRVCELGKLEGALCVKGRNDCYRSSPTDFELLCATQPGATDGGDRCFKRFNTMPGGFCNTADTNNGSPPGPNCLDTEYCNSGLCETRRAVGLACGTNSEVCQAGSRCVSGICTAYGDVGATCTASDQCKALLYCNATTPGGMGTCQPFLSVIGGPCSNNGFPSCTSGSFCPGQGMQTCVAQKPNGQACTVTNSEECLNGGCNAVCGNACWR
jgi:hypothetical protein